MPQTTDELFVAAVRVHSRRLLAIARTIVGPRASAEDVVQQALTNLYQHRDRYDWRDPGPLMRRSVVNESLRLLRQPKMSVVADDHPGATAGHESPLRGMIDREAIQKVRDAISTLPEHFRAVLVLCEYEQMSYLQISELLGASVPQVKTWLHRGRRQLARKLKGFVEDEFLEREASGGDAEKGQPVATKPVSGGPDVAGSKRKRGGG